MDAHLLALRASVDRLHALAAALDEAQLETPGYPSDWTVAQVLSHIGSGAEILLRRVEDARDDRPTPDDAAPKVWAVWNAKSARSMRDDALVADRALLDRIASVTVAERHEFRFPLGPMTFDFLGFVGLRLNEHAMHTWDIEVAFDAAAALPADAAALIVDDLDVVARFTAKPTGATRTIAVRTTDPTRDFSVDLTPEAASLTAGAAGREPDLILPAEAFARLAYGRLDPAHTPSVGGEANALDVLDELRLVFPGP